VLPSFAVKRGRVFPSLDTIARMAMVSRSIVLRAVSWLALYGFLDKLRRIVRKVGTLGPRTVQTSNAYVLRFPKGLGMARSIAVGSPIKPLITGESRGENQQEPRTSSGLSTHLIGGQRRHRQGQRETPAPRHPGLRQASRIWDRRCNSKASRTRYSPPNWSCQVPLLTRMNA
jgi:hypothetical protein